MRDAPGRSPLTRRLKQPPPSPPLAGPSGERGEIKRQEQSRGCARREARLASPLATTGRPFQGRRGEEEGRRKREEGREAHVEAEPSPSPKQRHLSQGERKGVEPRQERGRGGRRRRGK